MVFGSNRGRSNQNESRGSSWEVDTEYRPHSPPICAVINAPSSSNSLPTLRLPCSVLLRRCHSRLQVHVIQRRGLRTGNGNSIHRKVPIQNVAQGLCLIPLSMFKRWRCVLTPNWIELPHTSGIAVYAKARHCPNLYRLATVCNRNLSEWKRANSRRNKFPPSPVLLVLSLSGKVVCCSQVPRAQDLT